MNEQPIQLEKDEICWTELHFTTCFNKTGLINLFKPLSLASKKSYVPVLEHY